VKARTQRAWASIRRLVSGVFWRTEFSVYRAAEYFLAACSIMWGVVEAVSYFLPESVVDIRPHWLLFVGAGLAYALFRSRPLSSIEAKVEGRDICIEIRVVDIMKLDGYAVVVPFNSRFDPTLDALKTDSSIAGLVLKNCYSTHVEQLRADLNRALDKVTPESSSEEEIRRYKLGTVATTRAADRTFHFLAMSDVGHRGRAVGSFEGVKGSLPSLWSFLATDADKGDLAIPVIGTGKLRLTTPREEVIREIVRSFIAATAERVFCERLCVAIYPGDVAKYRMDLAKLKRFLEHECEFASFDRGADPTGVAIPVDAPEINDASA